MVGFEIEEKALEANITNPWVITSIVAILLVTVGLIYYCAKKSPIVDKDDEY